MFYTIGHSTHSAEEFVSLLKAYDIESLVDVRSYPGSRHEPQFNQENMKKWLPEASIEYHHMTDLGGRRKKNQDIDYSLVDGWRNNSFKNYAAYTLTKEYKEGIDKLIRCNQKQQVCYMCSESVPWRCHRLLISNTLTQQGMAVDHIMSEKKTIHHEVGLFGAKPILKDGVLIYPKQDDEEE